MARHEAVDLDGRYAITSEVKDFLARTGMSDTELGRRTNVPQTFIWHLKRGNFARVTPRMRRVLQYIHIKGEVADQDVTGVNQAIEGFIAAGGDLAILKSSIEMLTRAYSDN